MTSAPGSDRTGHFVFFLPYLRLGRDYTVGGVTFWPLEDANGHTPELIMSAAEPARRILSSYRDRHGKPLSNGVILTKEGLGWDLTPEDFEEARSATSLLFLAAWSANEYFAKFGRPYSNSTAFRMVAQAYRGDLPHYITLSSRRRDGGTLDGGYKHGEVGFNVPLQVSLRDPVTVDEALLEALVAAQAAGAQILDDLRTALPFVELANTDDDFMTPHNEAILMASAFEQLFQGAKKYTLGDRFANLFRSFGSVTVAAAQQTRPNLTIDTSTPERAAAQPNWWVHQKWIEELYDVRSKAVHRGTTTTRLWGWTAAEHLVMAAHVFPVTVKLLLEADGFYTRTEDDDVRCMIVDKVLASPAWVEDDDDGPESEESWTAIATKARRDLASEKVWESVQSKLDRHSDADEPADQG